MSKIAFVTEELAVYGRSGGIGAAVFELAVILAQHGHQVDIHYFPTETPSQEHQAFVVKAFLDRRIRLKFVDGANDVAPTSSPQSRAYIVYRRLVATNYDFIHFHDYKGLGFFCGTTKKLGHAFANTCLVTQLHGPTRWTVHANRSVFVHRDQLVIDFLERTAISQSDHVVSPSRYLVDWLDENGFDLPDPERIHVIKNVYSNCASMSNAASEPANVPVTIKKIIFFGRHEPRKGLVTFCDALDIIADDLAEQNISVTFVGGFSEINGRHSGIYLTERAKLWRFPLDIRVGFDRMDSIVFLGSQRDALVVIPSNAENSPYTVVEALAANCPILTSLAGGARELVEETFHGEAVVEIEPDAIAHRLTQLIRDGVRVPRFAESATDVERQWLDFHETHKVVPVQEAAKSSSKPKVVIGIVHYERPRKVVGAIMSVLRQTYDNIELVVIDDGSSKESTLKALPEVEKLVRRVGGTFIRQKNGYLGAARNAIARATTSEYLLFLDDDDLLYQQAVEKMVAAALYSESDIVNCLNVFMDETRRAEFEMTPETFSQNVSYVPLAGPLSLAHLDNHLGAATALIKRSFFDELGGYTELKRVGYEDYEFYVRAVQAGGKVHILPEPLYLYEVGKPSMISGTSRLTNKLRVLEAIDVGTRPEAWRDALEVAGGAASLENQWNYNRWSMSISPHKEILERIVGSAKDSSALVSALADYSNAIGASHLAATWQQALDRPERGEATGLRQTTSIRSQRKPDSVVEPPDGSDVGLTAELAALMKLGRLDEVASTIESNLKKGNSISKIVIEFSYLLAAAKGMNVSVAEPLIEILSDHPVETDLITQLRGAIASLEIAAGRHDAAKMQLATIIDEESDNYIRIYDDLRNAYKDRAKELALQHFRDNGFSEGRIGFSTLAKVATVVSKIVGRDVYGWQLRDHYDDALGFAAANRAAKAGHLQSPRGLRRFLF